MLAEITSNAVQQVEPSLERLSKLDARWDKTMAAISLTARALKIGKSRLRRFST
jgi:hypothetical protein